MDAACPHLPVAPYGQPFENRPSWLIVAGCVQGTLDASATTWNCEPMDISQIGRHVGDRVRIRGGGVEETGTVEHVQSVTYTVGADGGPGARDIADGYVVVLDGQRLEFSPGDEFEVLGDA